MRGLLLLLSGCMFDAGPGPSVVPMASTPPAAEPGTTSYGRAANRHGQTIEVRFAEGGPANVWVDGAQVTDDPWLQFSPAINDAGHTAYAVSRLSVRASEVWLDGRMVHAADTLSQHVRLSHTALVWVEQRIVEGENALCRMGISDRLRRCVELSSYPYGLQVRGETALLLGYQPADGAYRFQAFELEALELVAEETHPTPIFFVGEQLVVARGDPDLMVTFFALRELAGAQRGEPFADGNDHLGRISWNVADRLRGMSALMRKTGDARVARLIRSTVDRLLQRADARGLFASTKYSIDQASIAYLAVNNALIHHAILVNLDHLEGEQAARALAAAERAFEQYERDWIDGAYHFTAGAPIPHAGSVMPFNQQNMLGMMAMELHQATGEPRYRARVAALFDNLVAELEPSDGLMLWRYWPNRFGRPSELFEDVAHARINLEFMVAAAEMLDRTLPIDPEAISRSVDRGDGRFAFRLGPPGPVRPSYAWLPTFVQTPAVRRHYEGILAVPDADFERQPWFAAQALWALRAPALSGPMRLTHHRWDGDRWTAAAELDLGCNADHGCWKDFVTYWLGPQVHKRLPKTARTE